MAQTAGRGTSWVSVVLGWLAALGAALILSSIVGAIVGALFAALGAKSGTTGGGISGVIGFLLTLLSLLPGGYAAGRMASRSGVKHGLFVALLALVVTIVLALVGAAVGASFSDQLGGVTLPGPASKAAERPAARVEHDPLGLWHPRPVVPVHRRSTRGCARGHSRTRAPLPTLKKG